jgi:GT2 family glycosyltransferase
VPERVESNPAAVTIVVVPRERFSVAVRSLETLLRNTPPPFRLIYVDGGSPPPVARRLAAEVAAKGFELIRTEQFLAPNEARNLAFARVTDPYVVFVDNDLLVEPGWLDRLVRCAEETGADLVGPLYGMGEPAEGRVHMAGGLARIEERGGQRHLNEKHRFAGRCAAEIEGDLKREPTELLEFHCLLVRSATLRSLGGLDEGFLSSGEHIDLCLLVRERGGGVYLEPESRVTYLIPTSLDAFDRSYFRLRWSESWTRASLERLREKWGLARRDPYLAEHFHWLRSHRRLAVQPAERALQSVLGKSLARPARIALAAAEIAWNRLQFPRSRPAGADRSLQTRP